MKAARKPDNECRSGRDFPVSWRSTFLRREIPTVPQGPWGNTDAAILLGKHVVSSRTVSVIRRITANPFGYDRESGALYFNGDPAWWMPSPINPGQAWWDWQWNVGRYGLDRRNESIQPGFLLQAPFGRIRDVLGFQTFEFCNDWQRLSDHGGITMGITDHRYIVEGPQVVMLWAIATLTGYTTGKAPPSPFGSSFGGLEGCDVPIDVWKDNPAQWLIP